MPTHDEPNLMTVPEVAREMRISRSAVYAYLASGELGSIKIGRSCRVRRSAVEGRSAPVRLGRGSIAFGAGVIPRPRRCHVRGQPVRT